MRSDEGYSYSVINEETIQFKYNGDIPLEYPGVWGEGWLANPGDLVRFGGGIMAIEGDTESISKLGFVQKSGYIEDGDLPPGVDPDQFNYHIIAPAIVIKQ